MKQALETRKPNVESINRLLMEFKAEGELVSGRFPRDVGEKIARLNQDWQVIIKLATLLRDKPVVVTEETVNVDINVEVESSMNLGAGFEAIDGEWSGS